MGTLVLPTFISVDGVMQAPGGPGEDPSDGFRHEGWLVPFADEDFGKMMVESIRSAAGFLLGRRTYDIFAAHWPRVPTEGDPVADALNTLPKWVASTTLTSPTWRNTTVLTGDVPAAVAKLKEQTDGTILIQGSGRLAQTLIEHDLIDEYRLLQFPVILGSGRRLFGNKTTPIALELIDTQTTSTGMLAQTYRPTGRAGTGTFRLDED
jgi:dihydrofolate reductase